MQTLHTASLPENVPLPLLRSLELPGPASAPVPMWLLDVNEGVATAARTASGARKKEDRQPRHHLVQLRTVQMRRYESEETYKQEDHQQVIEDLVERLRVTQPAARAATQVQWLFGMPEALSLRSPGGGRFVVLPESAGAISGAEPLGENQSLTLEVDAGQVLDLAPRGAKLLCLANASQDKHHQHLIVRPEDRGKALQLTINAGPYSQLKILTVMPFGAFRVVKSRYANRIAYMSEYLGRTAEPGSQPAVQIEYVHDLTPEQAFDNSFPASGKGMGSNNLIVEDTNKTILGYRTRYKALSTYGLVYPSSGDWEAADQAGHGVFAYKVAQSLSGVSESRRKIISAFSWVEGPLDSINTYDAVDRLSWGILHWISNAGSKKGAALDGELNHLMAYLYTEHEESFEQAFGAFGFSVWFKNTKDQAGNSVPIEYDAPKSGGRFPFPRPVILMPGCHGPRLRAALEARQRGTWQDRRAVYGTWVFRLAGQSPDLQLGQLEWVNHRLTALFKRMEAGGSVKKGRKRKKGQKSESAGIPAAPKGVSEQEMAYALEKDVNGGGNRSQRRGQIDACAKFLKLTLDTDPGSFKP